MTIPATTNQGTTSPNQLYGMSICSNGEVVAVLYEKFLRFFDANSGAKLLELPQSMPPGAHVALSPAVPVLAIANGKHLDLLRMDP
ncbi:MAG: hypothetical protein NVSMB1_12610 [Polyangiales bacterium]